MRGRKRLKIAEKLKGVSIYLLPDEWKDFQQTTEEQGTYPSEELRSYVQKYNRKHKKK